MKINWLIHFGGDPVESVFSGEIVEFLGRTQFMESLDGGSSYNKLSSFAKASKDA